MKVSELVAKLQEVTNDMDVVIADADTYWWLNLESAGEVDGVFVLQGDYGNIRIHKREGN